MGDQDIDFRLNTQADPAGADKVIDKFDELKEKVVDLGEASEEAGKKSEKLETNDREANLRGRAVEWVKVGEAVKNYGALAVKAAGDLDGLDEKTKALVRSAGEGAEKVGGLVSSIAQGFAAGGPIGAILAGATQGVLEFVGAWGQAKAAAEDSDKAGQRAVDTWKALRELNGKLPLLDSMEQVNKLLDQELEKLQRNERVRQASSRADTAVSQEANAAAVAAGTKTQGQADAANLGDSFRQQAAAILKSLEIAKTAQNVLESEADNLAANSKAGSVLEGFATLDAQLKATETKQAEVVAGAKRLADNLKIGEEQLRELEAKSQGAGREIGEAGLQALTEAVTNERDALKAEVDRLGSRASTGARSALAILEQILADGQLRADEVAKYNQSIGLLNRTQELNNAAVLEAFQEGMKLSAAYGTEIVGVKREMALQAASFRQQIDALKQQQQFSQSGY